MLMSIFFSFKMFFKEYPSQLPNSQNYCNFRQLYWQHLVKYTVLFSARHSAYKILYPNSVGPTPGMGVKVNGTWCERL